MTYRISSFRPVGLGEHRSGWPAVVEALRALSDPAAPVFLEDFAEASFSYDGSRLAHADYTGPWVGIFHHPASITSPLKGDVKSAVAEIFKSPRWTPAIAANCVGAIALCPLVQRVLVDTLPNAATLVTRHPCADDCRQWNADVYEAQPMVFQTGYFLRDVRAIYQVAPEGHERARSSCRLQWHKFRDADLHRKQRRTERATKDVRQLPRLTNEEYDSFMARSVVLTHLYGAAANNVVVECVARCAPIAVNRLPSVEFYLGKEYPLFYDRLDEVTRMIEDRARVLAAHEYLASMDRSWLSVERFASEVAGFVGAFCSRAVAC